MMTPRMSVKLSCTKGDARQQDNQDSTPEDGTQRVKHQEFQVEWRNTCDDQMKVRTKGTTTDDERAPAMVCE